MTTDHPADALAAAVEAAQQALNQITGPAWREIMPVRDRLVAALAAYRAAQADQWLPAGEVPPTPEPNGLLATYDADTGEVDVVWCGPSRKPWEKHLRWSRPISVPPPPVDGEAKP